MLDEIDALTQEIRSAETKLDELVKKRTELMYQAVKAGVISKRKLAAKIGVTPQAVGLILKKYEAGLERSGGAE